MTPPPFYKLYKKTGKLVSGGFPYTDLKISHEKVAAKRIRKVVLIQVVPNQ